jgi:hypothetical protein
VRPLIDHLQEVAWVYFLVLLFLASLFLIFGSQIGFGIVFLACLGFAVIVAALFIMILLTEFLWVGMLKLFRHIFKKN